eukprot:6474535-Amphidinium_carterae.1
MRKASEWKMSKLAVNAGYCVCVCVRTVALANRDFSEGEPKRGKQAVLCATGSSQPACKLANGRHTRTLRISALGRGRMCTPWRVQHKSA